MEDKQTNHRVSMGNSSNSLAPPPMPEEVRTACMGKFHRSIGELVMRFCRLDRGNMSAVVRFRSDTNKLLMEMRGSSACNPLDIDALAYLLVHSTPAVAASVPDPVDAEREDDSDITAEEMDWQGLGAQSGYKHRRNAYDSSSGSESDEPSSKRARHPALRSPYYGPPGRSHPTTDHRMRTLPEVRSRVPPDYFFGQPKRTRTV